VLSGAVSLALALLAEPIADAYDVPGLAGPLHWTALGLFAQSLFTLVTAAFVAMGRTSLQAVLYGAESVAELGLVVLAVVLGGEAAGATLGRAGAFSVAAVAGIALAVRLLGRRIAPTRRFVGPGRRLATYAGALLIVDAAFALFSNIDVLLIGAYLGPEEVGLFEAPLRFVTMLSLIGVAVTSAVAPRVVRHGSEPQDIASLETALRWLLILGVLAAVTLAVWADPIVRLVLGSEYEGAIVVLRWFALFVPLVMLGPLVTVSLNFLGVGARRIPIVLATVAVNAVADVILIPRVGVEGAAIGTSLAYALYLPAHVVLLRRVVRFSVGELARTAGRALVAAAALAAVLALLGTTSVSAPRVVLGALIGPVVFAGVLVAIGELPTAELRAGSDALRARLRAWVR
jgi:O-antigen/teichoic acid export membrane protein